MKTCGSCRHISRWDWNQWLCSHEDGPSGDVDPNDEEPCTILQGDSSLYTPLACGEDNDYTAVKRE